MLNGKSALPVYEDADKIDSLVTRLKEVLLEDSEAAQTTWQSLKHQIALHQVDAVIAWAMALKAMHAMADFRTALYFAGETYTTVGYGDIVLPTEWRQLSLFIAVSSLFSFGWTTGVLVGMVNKTYETHFSSMRKPT